MDKLVNNSADKSVNKDVGKSVNKPVEKAVDRLEDNRVDDFKTVAETAVETKAYATDWTENYARYFTQNLLNHHQFDAFQQQQIANTLTALLQASLNGDSNIATNSAQFSDLAPVFQAAAQLYTDPQQLAACVYEQDSVALYRYWRLEQRLSLEITRLTQQRVAVVDAGLAEGLLHDPDQQRALQQVCRQAFSIITGGPGTGKTYTLARIIALLQHGLAKLRIAMAAPTGKAAQRMQEALQLALAAPELQATGWISPALRQQRTQTLHRLLGMGHQQQPRFNRQQPLPYDVIVVDEASMLDLSLATALFEAVAPNARLILLGDAQQLASVDVGSVLADLQACAALQPYRVHLRHSRRFHADAAIGRCAAFIQAQAGAAPQAAHIAHPLAQAFFHQVAAPIDYPAMRDLHADEIDRVQCCELPTDANAAVQHYYDSLMSGFLPYVQALKAYLQQPSPQQACLQAVVNAFDDYRILTGVKHGAWGVAQLNRVAARWLQQQLAVAQGSHFYVGRAVMMTYNDYSLGLSNGDIGICLPARTTLDSGNSQPESFDVYFPSLAQWFAAQRLPQNVQDAFALTIHKSQGSEFRHCAVLLTQDAEKVLSRELFYTAISRAKQVVSLWLHTAALQQALQRDSSRRSGLLQHLARQIT